MQNLSPLGLVSMPGLCVESFFRSPLLRFIFFMLDKSSRETQFSLCSNVVARGAS